MKERREVLMAALAEQVNQKFPSLPIQKGNGMFFRACGKGQEPWDLLKDGFVHRYGKRTASELKVYLAAIYGKKYGGAKTYMAQYRVSAANNPANVPFISAGIEPEDGSGASNAFWQFAMKLPQLNEIQVTAALLGENITLSDDVGDVRLYIDGNDFDRATTRVLLHGPLPEATWLSHAGRDNIVAWVRLGGSPWQQKWRVFDDKTVLGVKKLALEYEVDISQS